MVSTPHTADGCEDNKRPLSSLPGNAVYGGARKKRAWPWPDRDWPPVGGIILVSRKCSLREVKHEGCCQDVGKD